MRKCSRRKRFLSWSQDRSIFFFYSKSPGWRSFCTSGGVICILNGPRDLARACECVYPCVSAGAPTARDFPMITVKITCIDARGDLEFAEILFNRKKKKKKKKNRKILYKKFVLYVILIVEASITSRSL